MVKSPEQFHDDRVDLNRRVTLLNQKQEIENAEEIKALQEDQVSIIMKEKKEEYEKLMKLAQKFNIPINNYSQLEFKDLIM